MRRDVAGFFVRPAERAATVPSPRPRSGVATLIVVICAASGAQSLGAAVALVAARARRSPCALVATWTGDPAGSIGLVAPPLSGARRLAAGLVARGLDARPAGRLVHVPLPPADSEAAVLAERTFAAARGVPMVLVVGGPRGSAFDDLLAGSDLAVVMTAPDCEPLIAELACSPSSLPAPALVACSPALGIAGRTLAVAGLGLVPSLRAALDPVVEALR